MLGQSVIIPIDLTKCRNWKISHAGMTDWSYTALFDDTIILACITKQTMTDDWWMELFLIPDGIWSEHTKWNMIGCNQWHSWFCGCRMLQLVDSDSKAGWPRNTIDIPLENLLYLYYSINPSWTQQKFYFVALATDKESSRQLCRQPSKVAFTLPG